jgi:hypothetical protein
VVVLVLVHREVEWRYVPRTSSLGLVESSKEGMSAWEVFSLEIAIVKVVCLYIYISMRLTPFNIGSE